MNVEDIYLGRPVIPDNQHKLFTRRNEKYKLYGSKRMNNIYTVIYIVTYNCFLRTHLGFGFGKSFLKMTYFSEINDPYDHVDIVMWFWKIELEVQFGWFFHLSATSGESRHL